MEPQESVFDKARRYVSESETAYESRDYVTAVENARHGLYEAQKHTASPHFMVIACRLLEITNEALVLVWSDINSHAEDLNSILRPAKYVLDTVDYLTDEEKKAELITERNQLETVIENLDQSWKNERALSSELKKQCDEDGKEINPEQTAIILHDLAKIHAKRSPDKLSLLYAGALLKAALIRSSDSKKILKAIKSLNKTVLKAANAKSFEYDLHEIAQDVFKKNVLKMRDTANTMLKEIGFECAGTFQENLKQCVAYANKMKDITSKIADDYATTMSAISQQCLEILGQPPCKFSHIAMGSLPRREITTHSDLESAIILENDAKKREDFQDILEYFRWYSVVFQIIVIFFGESPLRLMGIPCLNDFYFHNNEKDWFWDDITPCGIQFDSMMPFSSKFPLGRLPTENKPYPTELIKTSKDMIKFVSVVDAKEDDYKLSSMLVKTRFIGGNEGLHRKFEKRVRRCAYSDSNKGTIFRDMILQHMGRNIQTFSFREVVLGDGVLHQIINVKKATYRTVTIFIEAIGHLAHFELCSSFEIVEQLQREGLLGENSAARLLFAVAIACQIRLLIYLERDSQQELVPSGRHIARHHNAEKVNDVFDAVGKWNFSKFLLIISDLQKSAGDIVESGGRIDCLKNRPMETRDAEEISEVYAHFGLYYEALSCLDKHDSRIHPAFCNAFTYFIKGICLTKVGRYDEANENLDVCLAILLSLPEADQPKIIHFVQYCIGKNMLDAHNLTQAKEHLYGAKDALECSSDIQSAQGEELYLAILDAITELDFLAGEYTRALEKCEELRQKNSQLGNRYSGLVYRSMIRSCDCLFRLGHYRRCVFELEKALQFYYQTHGYRMIQRKKKHSSSVLPVLLQLGDCYMKLNQAATAEGYCKEALDTIDRLQQQDQYDVAHVKLVLSQCYLRQNKYKRAAESAREAFTTAFDTNYPNASRLTVTQAAVHVILRCMKPQRGSIDAPAEYEEDDLRTTLECASSVFNAINKQTVFENTRMERDKSILVRVIQRGLYELNGYDCLLRFCKQAIFENEGESTSVPLFNGLLNILINDDKLQSNCERDCDHLFNVARFCNVRDSFSASGAIIIFSGWMFRTYKRYSLAEGTLQKLMQQWLSEQETEKKMLTLHCAVKLAKLLVDVLVNKKETKSVTSNAILLGFVGEVYSMCLSQANASTDLLHETCSLMTTAAVCLVKMRQYERALEVLRKALELQEKLSSDFASTTFLDTSTIIQNIGICLAKLQRWEEANEYLNRSAQMKETRRKSRACEDNSILNVKVKSAQCSYALGNYREAALMASEAFHEGLGIDSEEKQHQSMVSAANIVLKSALAVSVHAQVVTTKSSYEKEVTRSVVDRAIGLRTTLEDHVQQLGSDFTEMIDSFYYACGNCHYVLDEYKAALKCFKKSLRISTRRGQITTIEKPITLNIAKSLLGLRKFLKAEAALHNLLAMGRDKIFVVHSHPSHAYILLASCSIGRHLYKLAFCQANEALSTALATDSALLREQICTNSANIFLVILNMALSPIELD